MSFVNPDSTILMPKIQAHAVSKSGPYSHRRQLSMWAVGSETAHKVSTEKDGGLSLMISSR